MMITPDRALILAAKAALRTALAAYVRPSDIYVTPHLAFVPSSVRTPCVGIKDGKIKREELVGGCVEHEIEIQYCLFVGIRREEASIVGDESTGAKGLLQLRDDLHAALHGNTLGVHGVHGAFAARESGSDLFDSGAGMMQRKIVTYTYEVQR